MGEIVVILAVAFVIVPSSSTFECKHGFLLPPGDTFSWTRNSRWCGDLDTSHTEHCVLNKSNVILIFGGWIYWEQVSSHEVIKSADIRLTLLSLLNDSFIVVGSVKKTKPKMFDTKFSYTILAVLTVQVRGLSWR